ncbi:protein immune deficiency-like [Anopheles bellator]|uniref:protein immune deficiency-like n=1 Tax=Anopheles bellator TaxID=139047 RepID=UPI002648FFDD|nr:protein immune deficiency-like [Anopheles bellator]
MAKLFKFMSVKNKDKNFMSKLETDATPMPRANGKNKAVSASTNNGSAFVNANISGTEQFASLALGSGISLAEVPTEAMAIPEEPSAHTVVNNVHYNALAAPQQTSISNTSAKMVFHIKNSSNVHIGNSYTMEPTNGCNDCKTDHKEHVKWANLKLSNTITQMMKSSDELEPEMLEIVSRHLGYEWKSFARKLEYSEGQIDAFEADNPTLSEQIYHFLLDWTQNEDNPTLGRLVSLLWENKHKETVYYMKREWKCRKENLSS